VASKRDDRRQTAREIDLAAAAWAAKADRGLSPDEEAVLQAWLTGDPRRAGAYAKALAVSLHTRRAAALGPGYRATDFARQPRAVSRRALMAGAGGAVAAGVGAALVVGLDGGRRFDTRLGEVRIIPLQDGSVVTLNTLSSIFVGFSKRRRDIRLISGEALFDVAKDAARPFVVTAGDAQVRAVGTSFSVARLPSAQVEVLVREGVVAVGQAGSAISQALRLGANQKAAVSRTSIVHAPVPDAELNRQLAWKEGRLSFSGQTLEAAAAEFARYSDVKIVIENPSLKNRQVVGLYQANDPTGFAKAVASAFDARVEIGAGEVRLTR
jgi:transmembrane sensor